MDTADATSPAPRLAGELTNLLDGSLGVEDFVAAIVHEAAQPLTAIQMLAAAMRHSGDAIDEEKRDRLLADIESQARYLRDLSDWMLRPFAREVVDLGDLVATAVDRCRALADQHTLTTVPADPGLMVECESVRVEASLRNIICNAVRYSPAGGEVSVHARREGDLAVVAVADRGGGIPRTEWENIFKPYVRLADGDEGKGIGLYISRSCALRHGGDAYVKESGPAGTTVELSLLAVT